MADLIDSVADRVECWLGINLNTGINMWTIREGTAAHDETHSQEVRLDGAPWGERPARTVYQYVQMTMKHDQELCRSVATLVRANRLAPAIEVLVRSCIDSASVAWWLLDDTISKRQRVCRLQLLRRRNAEYYRQALEVTGQQLSPDEFESVEKIDAYSESLALGKVVRGRLGGERVPKYTDRSEDFERDAGIQGAYRIYSAAAHSELAGTWRMFRQGASDLATRVPIYVTFRDEVLIFHGVNVLFKCLLSPFYRIAELFGWNQDDNWVLEFNGLLDQIDGTMESLKPE